MQGGGGHGKNIKVEGVFVETKEKANGSE